MPYNTWGSWIGNNIHKCRLCHMTYVNRRRHLQSAWHKDKIQEAIYNAG